MVLPVAPPPVWHAEMLPRRRFLVIHNPVAGARRARHLRATIEALAERYGAQVTVRPTAGRGDAEAMARALAPGSFDAVVVAGGDGTINEAVNGLAARGAKASGIPLGIVPLGTANVLAHELNLPLDAPGTADVLALGSLKPVHLGVANGRCFAMMAGAGLDARVVERVSGRLKRLVGKGAYVIGTLARLAEPGQRHYHVTVDGETWEVASVVVANGHYYGGRFVCAPDACLTDPHLHVCLFLHPGRWNAVRYLWGVTAGRLPHFPDYRVVPAERIAITGPEGEVVQGDGDVIARLPVDIALSPSRLPMIVPHRLPLAIA